MLKPDSIRELLEFFRLDEGDLAALAGLREALASEADRIVDEFYNHLLRFEETQQLLRDPTVRERLLAKQREYLISLADPFIGEDYVASRARIGAVHERVGLDTRWYLGAYALYFSLLVPLIRDAVGPDPIEIERVTTAMGKRLALDAEIAIRQYTDRREEDLKRLNEELRSAGQFLTREVDETARNLRRTEARAVAAEQLASVATLVTGLAHEVGTPMGVIRGHTEALEGAVEGDRAKWRLNMIIEQIDRITNIIQSLLNFARPKQMMRVPLDLPGLIDSSVAFLSEKLRRRGVVVETRYEPVPLSIGDPEKMQQIFLNLLINAVDAMADGGVIDVSLERDGDSGLRITIGDSGAGIPEDQLATIFDPFFTTKAAGHGSGLGLVVVRSIVGDHGGRIEAYSEAGNGTQFQIWLPAGASD
jgi:signal transduction histidine kinase